MRVENASGTGRQVHLSVLHPGVRDGLRKKTAAAPWPSWREGMRPRCKRKKLFESIQGALKSDDIGVIRDRFDSFNDLRGWLTLDDLDRHTVNLRIEKFAADDEVWVWKLKEAGHESTNTDGR